MDVNFEYYKIFYYVAKYHNFTKAAQALNNSQPNITRHELSGTTAEYHFIYPYQPRRTAHSGRRTAL